MEAALGDERTILGFAIVREGWLGGEGILGASDDVVSRNGGGGKALRVIGWRIWGEDAVTGLEEEAGLLDGEPEQWSGRRSRYLGGNLTRRGFLMECCHHRSGQREE